MHTADSLIIGAGIAGLLAATELQKVGQRVTVLDKGQGVGGRMATRRFAHAGVMADHGAQFFTVRDNRFQQRVTAWMAAGAAAEWCLGFAEHDGHPRYRGVPGMTGIPKLLARGLTVHTSTRVVKIEQEDGRWQVTAASGDRYRADNLILTPPVPQSLALLDSGPISLPAASRTALESIRYHPCFAVLVHLSQASQIPPPGGVQVCGEIIDWIGDNRQKGVSEATTVTIHASPQFTRQHLERDRAEVGELLVAAADKAGYFAAADLVEMQVHRWLYAKPVTHYPERCLRLDLNGLPLVFAGDAFKHARVEGAALSGLAAADSLIGS